MIEQRDDLLRGWPIDGAHRLHYFLE